MVVENQIILFVSMIIVKIADLEQDGKAKLLGKGKT